MYWSGNKQSEQEKDMGPRIANRKGKTNNDGRCRLGKSMIGYRLYPGSRTLTPQEWVDKYIICTARAGKKTCSLTCSRLRDVCVTGVHHALGSKPPESV